MVTYCTADDVKRILATSYSYSTSTNPTTAQVEAFIESAEDDIDQKTQHAWREKIVTEEFYDIPNLNNYNQSVGVPIRLRHRKVRTFDTDEGDKVEIWNGSAYDDWLVTKTQGRANDFWLQNDQGLLYLRYYFAFYRKNAVKLTYRYGETEVPKDIRDACAMIAAIKVLRSDDRSANLNETSDPTRQNYDGRISGMQKDIDNILRNRIELRCI